MKTNEVLLGIVISFIGGVGLSLVILGESSTTKLIGLLLENFIVVFIANDYIAEKTMVVTGKLVKWLKTLWKKA